MANTVRIVTDSTCDLPGSLLREYKIEMVPLNVYFGDEEYTDGINLAKHQFYRLLNSSKLAPTTSQPPPAKYITLYDKIRYEGIKKIISLHVSSKLSGTVNTACIAAETFKHSDMNIDVIDSKTISMGLGFIVLEAARQALNEEDILTIKEKIHSTIPKIKIYFAVPSLKYLQKGGRIGRISALVGELALRAPILTIKDGFGEVELVKKCKREEIIDELIGIARMEHRLNTIKSLSILYSPPVPQLTKLEWRLGQEFPRLAISVEMVGPVVGSHVGPAALGVAMQTLR